MERSYDQAKMEREVMESKTSFGGNQDREGLHKIHSATMLLSLTLLAASKTSTKVSIWDLFNSIICDFLPSFVLISNDRTISGSRMFAALSLAITNYQ